MRELTDQPVVVMGAARSGVAAALLLARHGARVTLTELQPTLDRGPGTGTNEVSTEADDTRRQLEEAGVCLELGGHRRETLAAARLVVLSPGVPATQPLLEVARRNGTPIVGEIEVASRYLRGRIVAITGTKGKSTTSVLTGRMLEAGGWRTLVGGNIGVPLSAQVSASTPETIHVVEVSSFQLETIARFHPWVAVLLNVTVDHLDRHASVEEYVRVKSRIFENQGGEDWAVVNADDPQALALARAGRARVFGYSYGEPGAAPHPGDGVFIQPEGIARRWAGRDETLVPRAAIKLRGEHMLGNVAAAAAVATLSGVSADAMTRAVASFEGLEHVMEPVGTIERVAFVNDSKATNLDAARRSIEACGSPAVVILGGRYKGGDFRDLTPALLQRGARVVAIGEAQGRIHSALESSVAVHDAASMAEAVRLAFDLVRPHGSVLLAPACSSLDLFADYADRGRTFKREVARLRQTVEGGSLRTPSRG